MVKVRLENGAFFSGEIGGERNQFTRFLLAVVDGLGLLGQLFLGALFRELLSRVNFTLMKVSTCPSI